MCGINGFINLKNGNKELLKKMNKVINHRGPDDSGIFFDEQKNIGLAHVRLSILDLSDAGYQPIYYNKNLGGSNNNYRSENINLSKNTIIFNGEIYNFKDIKNELINKGYNFSTKTDTEVILASYIEWGEKCVEKFNGMWAFCIYDKIKNKVFCSRDRMGKKPFYYFWNGENFIFSSEIKGILETGIDRILNIDELENYLLFHYTPGENTLFKNVFKLPSSSNLIFDLNKKTFKINKYWDIENDEILYTDFKITTNIVDEILNDSVKIRTESSDVPVGTFLSGGLDSSLTSALFKKYYKGNEFHTFNVIWEDHIPNEGKYANIVSNYLNSKHHTLKITGQDVLDNLEKLQWHYDDPIAEAGFIPNFFVSKYAKDYVKVILTGDGGDEVFAGYSYYNFWQKFWLIGQIPGVKFISKILSKTLATSKYQKGFEFLSNSSWNNYHNFIGFTISNFSKKELNKILTIKFNKNKIYFNIIKKTIKKFNSFLNQTQYTDQKILLSECYNIKPDKALMANNLEGRAPLQDYRLVEIAYHIPNNFKIKNGKEKYILTKIGEKYLPKKIFERKKQGYGVPIYEWINNELKNIVIDYIENSILVEKGYFNKDQIKFYLKNIDKKYFSTRIWNLFSLELFIKTYNLKIK